jgi:hypothetical protein
VRRARPFLLAAVAVTVGYLVAHALLAAGSHGGRTPPAVRTSDRASAAPSGGSGDSRPSPDHQPGMWAGPSRAVGRVPVGFSRSERGAVAAAGNYVTVLSRALTPGAPFSWAQAIRALTVVPLTSRALSGSAAGARIADRFAQSRSSFYLRSWLLGYQIQSYFPTRARVALWNVGVVTSALGVVPPDFSTTTCQLRWIGGDWKVSEVRVSEGPTPPSSPAGSAAQALAFAAAARRFATYTNVP